MRCIRHTSASEILAISNDFDIVRRALGHSINTSHTKTYISLDTSKFEVLFPSSSFKSSNFGMGKNISRYAQCTKILDSSISKQIADNLPIDIQLFLKVS